MKSDLSIFIPTYKRNEALFETIRSTRGIQDIQVIISDNNEDINLSNEIQDFISQYANIKYHRNQVNIGLDRNMLNFIPLCETKYCLLLGDDDVLTEKFALIFEHIENDADFLLLNNTSLSTGVIPIDTNREKASLFEKIWNKMPFGTLIINVQKARLIKQELEKYIGTYHAYSAVVWEILCSDHSSNKMINIQEKVIQLGVIDKSWKQSTVEIHFVSIPLWFGLLPEQLNKTGQQVLKFFVKSTFNWRFFRQLLKNGLLNNTNYSRTVGQLPLKYRLVYHLSKISLTVKK
ncbi:glycosyltransferase [Pedobacter metabolipauper]|uniref:Glycosyl transferase family 2 n=1 Tax=Pedobacter metabolipauper TaxID=425513 RepID=A0A4R6SWY8_9SPHI|nr:glycosyltransferase [Pedobacter metabolipauper]TDQ09961.1 glycosyl transferase family 2 [Pedobacter metabolipauper]